MITIFLLTEIPFRLFIAPPVFYVLPRFRKPIVNLQRAERCSRLTFPTQTHQKPTKFFLFRALSLYSCTADYTLARHTE